ncbi:tail protein X [Pseudomonas nitroreducens]|uniref:tail protein X n=1 Tax=Pseudomonas nitroreducens TaxID=46680 RepID=UPI002658D376|nr:tail protein X [Pseudomonas nitroreducens]MCP1652626.1 phage tail protein X [Pseudomonas nitroreducens]MCP1689201.1 phage tail protein X [Pseudomonas nitroreducens]
MATTTIYRSSNGDVLDQLCYRRYGHLKGCMESVLNANPGLADEPQPLRAGVLIRMPDLAAPDNPQVRLWD